MTSSHIRHRMRHAALNVNGHRHAGSSPTSVVMGARWVLMRLMHSSLFTAAYSQQPFVAVSPSSVIIGCDDRRARRVPALVLVLAHHLAQCLAP
jgi:hypothetical protein